MFSYTISKHASETMFDNACSKIDSKAKGFKRERPLTDVDGSTIQTYQSAGRTIEVFNDYEVDAVYIDSDIDLSDILK